MYSMYQICTQLCRDNTKNQNQICTQSKDIQGFGIAHSRLRTERRRQRATRLTGEKLDALLAGDRRLQHRRCRCRQLTPLLQQGLLCNNFGTLIFGGFLSPSIACHHSPQRREDQATRRHGLHEEKFHSSVMICGGDLEKGLLTLSIIRLVQFTSNQNIGFCVPQTIEIIRVTSLAVLDDVAL